MFTKRIPIVIQIIFLIDIAFGVVYFANYLAGSPLGILDGLIDLDREGNLPTVYSSINWFCAATLFAIFAFTNFERKKRKTWPLMLLPLLFISFSIDEVSQIHEKLGARSDFFLEGGSRNNTVFSYTGIWMFIIGIPFIILFIILIRSILDYFRATPRALSMIILGMGIMLTGAIGIEILSNFVIAGSIHNVIQVLAEEMCELIGATIVIWGGYELLLNYGFSIHLEKVDLHNH